ncbi:hypothetical protein VQ056_26340 [Paenibacillus sp. JTLBN-2024]
MGAYHNLFTIMACVGAIMLLGLLAGKIVTGKGRSLVQKEKRLMMPKPEQNGSGAERRTFYEIRNKENDGYD